MAIDNDSFPPDVLEALHQGKNFEAITLSRLATGLGLKVSSLQTALQFGIDIKDMNNIFHKISYLQYPLMLIALFHTAVPYFSGFDTFWPSLNQALIFAGLGISFSTLQDTRKTQNDFSKKIWQDPAKGKRALLFISLSALAMLVFGLYGFYVSRNEVIKEVAFGLLMLGIGYVGLLKSAIEMFENHRSDKNHLPSN